MASWITIEKNNKLAYLGYVIYAGIIITCIITLFYPFIDQFFGLNINCIFQTITHLPCPTCGYSRAINNAFEGNLQVSFLYSPIWIVLIFYQVALILLSIKSIVLSKAYFISNKWIYIFIGLLILNWILKFIVGSDYY